MHKEEKIRLINQLKRTCDQMVEALDKQHPVCDWDYTSEQLQELNEEVEFRALQLDSRMKHLSSIIGEW